MSTKQGSDSNSESNPNDEWSHQYISQFTMTDFPGEILDLENDKLIMEDCMGASEGKNRSLEAPQPVEEEDFKEASFVEYSKPVDANIETHFTDEINQQRPITVKRENDDFSAQSKGANSKEKFKLRLAPASEGENLKVRLASPSVYQNRTEGVKKKKEMYRNLRHAPKQNKNSYDKSKEKSKKLKFGVSLAPDPYIETRMAGSDGIINNNQNESITVAPGAYAVAGIGADNTNDEEEAVEEAVVSGTPNLIQNQSSRSLIVADVIDGDEDRARIIGDFIAGTAQATIVKKKPIWKRRNLILGIFGSILLLIIGVVVLSLTLRESKNEKLLKVLQQISGKEIIEKQNTPQNKAYNWLLTDDQLDSINDIFVRERYIAAVFYFATGGSYWVDKFDFLNNQTSVCNWNDGNATGIHCNEDKMIKSISAVENNLTGILPSELSHLSSLETILVYSNMINGTISSSYGDLSRLRTLELSSNSLTGTIPREIFSMRNLNTLKISNNFLTGTIHADFTQLSSLEVLDLEENFLSGSMPSKFNRISRLKRISLSTNKLTGPIPESINILASTLETLQLVNNNLNMTIPRSFGELRRLNTLRLDSNSLSGSLPTELGLLIDLQSMSMKSNLLTGNIPSELRSLQRLWVLDLSNNRLTGSIPSELGNLQVIANMRLQQNRLTGILPTELASASTLGILSVFRNNLIGKVGDELCRRNIEIQADCLGSDPEIECDCCLCYRDDQPTSVHGGAVSCDGTAKKLIEDNLIKGTRGDVNCYCADTTGLHVRCDESCISCNLDETVCVENISFQMWIKNRDALFPDIYENKVKYIKGRNETIEWGSSGWEVNKVDTCWVRINGVECNSCALNNCANRNVPFISCSNVVGAGDYDGCDDIQVENAGVFEAISWSNRRSLSLTGETYCPVLDTLNIWRNFQ